MLRVPAARPAHHDASDPDPWLALRLDRSLPLDDGAREDLIGSMSSWSRRCLLPLLRPLARCAIVVIQLLKLLVPRGLTSSKWLHWTIARGLARFVRPDANRLILRHFHLGSEIARFIVDNSPVDVATTPIRPRCLDDLRDGLFVRHDVNLFNLVIALNHELSRRGLELAARPLDEIDFSAIQSDPPALDRMPARWTNQLDLASAIELYTPVYQLLLSDRDFWRASNSLQLDETIAIYVARILGDASLLGLVNNRHPLVPESTLRAGHRLLLHGLGTEVLHAALVELKERQRSAGDAGPRRAAALGALGYGASTPSPRKDATPCTDSTDSTSATTTTA